MSLSMHRRVVFCLLVVGAVFSAGCPGCIEKLAPGKVAAAVARLSMRNSAYAAKLVLADTKCGFKSPAVLRAALVQGETGGPGAVTLKVTGCTISLPELTPLADDCLGEHASVQGKVTFSGTQRIRGTLTGDAQTPVIPDSADAVTLDLEATFEEFKVTKTDSTNVMTIHGGKIAYVFEPRIALSRSLGVCSVQTLDFTFSNVRWSNGRATIQSPERTFPVDVPSSNLVAQVGKWQKDENSFAGELTVWDTKVALPLPKEEDPDGLDDLYTPKAYFDSISCDPDLVTPVNYACPSLKTQLVHGASRLSVKTVGALTSLVDADARCGFSSPQVLANAALSGTSGSAGSATFTLPAPCVISFSTTTEISKDCSGAKQFAQGTVSVTGTKKLTGVLTGDTSQPVAPSSRDPAELELTFELNNFVLSNSTGANTFTVREGRLSSIVKPRVAIDTRSSICSIATSIAEFPKVAWQDAKLLVNSSGFDFQVNVSQGQLVAQSGSKGERTNYLAGTMISDGAPVTIPPQGAGPILDPDYQEAAFLSSFSCEPGFQLAQTEAECSIDNALATNIARLTVQAAGNIASLTQNDTRCGFSALLVKTMPDEVTGSNGQMGQIRWGISNCTIGQTGPASLGADCSGTTTYLSGRANVSAQRVVKGERNAELVVFDSIIPRARDALTIKLTSVPLDELSTWTVLPSEVNPYAKLVIHSGILSGTVTPALGERKSKPQVYDVATPVATFTDVQLSNANVSFSVGGKKFNLEVPAVKVSALNGSLNGKSNTISGVVTLGNGHLITIAPTALDPEFEQKAFDSSYACTSDLKAPIPVQ